MLTLLPILFAAAMLIGVAKLVERYEIKLPVAAGIATVPPFIVTTFLLMAYSGRWQWDVVTIPAIIIFVIQYLLCLYVYLKIRYGQIDELFGWSVWLVGGSVVLYIIVPAVVHQLDSFLMLY